MVFTPRETVQTLMLNHCFFSGKTGILLVLEHERCARDDIGRCRPQFAQPIAIGGYRPMADTGIHALRNPLAFRLVASLHRPLEVSDTASL